MMLPGHILSLLVFLTVAMTLSDAQCAAETAAILSSPNVTAAYAQMNADIIQEVSTCVMDGNDNCKVTDADETGVQEACTAEGGKFSNPSLDIYCTNSNTGLATIIDYEYTVCVSANCTEAETDFEDAVDDALANITDAINQVVGPDGVQCGASLNSGATNMSMAYLMISLVALLSYSLI